MHSKRVTRRRCDACTYHVATSWLARHVASGCVVAPGLKPPTPKYWLDSSLRLRPYATLRPGVSNVRYLTERRKGKIRSD